MTLKAEVENAAVMYLQKHAIAMAATTNYVTAQNDLAVADQVLNQAAATLYNTLKFDGVSVIHLFVSGRVIKIPFGQAEKTQVLKVQS